MAGQQTLNLYVEVRLLCPQPDLYERTVIKVAVLLFMVDILDSGNPLFPPLTHDD